MIRQLDDRTLVSGQIAPHEVAGLAEQGVTMLVNNRPDGEEPGQPLAADIEAAAAAGGHRLPLRADHPRHRPGRRRSDAGGAARGRRRQAARLLPLGHALGARGALAHREEGASREEIEQRLTEAGFDPGPIAHLL